MSKRVTLIEPNQIRVDFDESEGTITFVDCSTEEGGIVSIPAYSWAGIAKEVNAALRNFRSNIGSCSR